MVRMPAASYYGSHGQCLSLRAMGSIVESWGDSLKVILEFKESCRDGIEFLVSHTQALIAHSSILRPQLQLSTNLSTWQLIEICALSRLTSSYSGQPLHFMYGYSVIHLATGAFSDSWQSSFCRNMVRDFVKHPLVCFFFLLTVSWFLLWISKFLKGRPQKWYALCRKSKCHPHS